MSGQGVSWEALWAIVISVGFLAYLAGYYVCRLILRAIVSDICGAAIARKVFG